VAKNRLMIPLLFALLLLTIFPTPAYGQADYAEYISWSGDAVGTCYPWLVFADGSVLNLVTGTRLVVAVPPVYEAGCGEETVALIGDDVVTIIDKETGAGKSIVVATNFTLVRVAGDVVALSTNDTVIVHTPGAGDYYIPLGLAENETLIDVDFNYFPNTGPVVAYITEYNGTRTLRIRTLTGLLHQRTVDVSTDAVLAIDGLVIYDGRYGLQALRIDSTAASSAWAYYLAFPGDIADLRGDTVTNIIAVDKLGGVYKISLADKTWEFIAQGAELTPVGVHVSGWTYVIDETIYMVPGRAVAVLGNAVVTTMGGTTVLYPVQATMFSTMVPLNGHLVLPDDGVSLYVAVDLVPGSYLLPRGSALVVGDKTIEVDGELVTYPPAAPAITTASTVEYRARLFPDAYTPVLELGGIRFATAGGGVIVAINDTAAIIVYSTYHEPLVIPGTWEWGGAGDAVVLYDGATLRVYDFAGNQIAAYPYFDGRPDYATVAGETVILYYHADRTITKIGAGYIEKVSVDEYRVTDPSTGLTLTFTTPPLVVLGDFVYPVPAPADQVAISRYSAAWGQNGTYSLLSTVDGAVYTVVAAPWPDAKPLPLGSKLALLHNGTLTVLPVKAWMDQGCYVDIYAPENATITVNGKYAGTGPHVRVYAECGELLTITAELPYHNPATQVVTVAPGGVTVELEPQPRIAQVTLEVRAPESLVVESVEMYIDGERTIWRVGEVRELVAGKEYNIRAVAFEPADVCEEVELTVTFDEGPNTLIIPCRLKGPVFAITSEVPVRVTVHYNNRPYATYTVLPGKPAYMLAPGAGDYTFIAEPLEDGYAARVVNATLPNTDPALYRVDVTPLPYGLIKVSVVPANATIVVTDMNGTVIATGAGTVEVQVPPGAYLIQATAPGYAPATEMVTVDAGTVVERTITLAPAARPEEPSPLQSPEVQAGAALAVLAGAGVIMWWRRRKRKKVITEESAEEVLGE